MKKVGLGLLVILLSVTGLSARINEDPDRRYPTYPMFLQVRSVVWCPEEGQWRVGSPLAGCRSDSSRGIFVGQTIRHTPNAWQSLWYQREIVNHYIVQ